MATVAQVKKERLDALRAVRRAQRSYDTQLEKVERRIFALLDRKTMLSLDDGHDLISRYNNMLSYLRDFERALSDFIVVLSG